MFCEEDRSWKIAEYPFDRRSDGTSQQDTSRNTMDATSVRYQAPELFDSTNSRITEKIDVWALGCIAYLLTTGMEVFPTNDAMYQFIFQKSAVVSIPELHLSFGGTKISTLLRQMLERDQVMRPSVGNIVSELSNGSGINQQDSLIQTRSPEGSSEISSQTERVQYFHLVSSNHELEVSRTKRRRMKK